MASNSLSPAFVRIDYKSEFGPHSMTIPSVPVTAAVGGVTPYKFDLRGLAVDTFVTESVTDWVNIIKVAFKNTIVFKSFTLFTQADAESTPLPVQGGILNIAGTNAAAGWYKAVQQTITFRTDTFGRFKIVLLDVNSYNSFDKLEVLTPGDLLEDIVDYATADVTWFAGRDGGRPDVFLQSAVTLNEKLRRSYRMN